MSNGNIDRDEKHGWLGEVLQGGVPQLIAGPAGKAISRLIAAGADIPAAWIEGIAQGVRDKTSGRSQVSKAIAAKAAEMATDDPKVMDRALDALLTKSYKAQTNREEVAKVAVEELKQLPPPDDAREGPSDDWMNVFIRFAEDASSKKLQEMFGRILAGEVTQPGAFSLATLRTIAELDQQTAQDFSLVWVRSVGGAVDYSPDFKIGEWYSRWARLAEVGLMAATPSRQHLPEYLPVINGNGIWCPMRAMGTFLNVHFPKNCNAKWANIQFTRIGMQIGSILALPDYEANIREAGLKLASAGVARIELKPAGKPTEVLFPTPDG